MKPNKNLLLVLAGMVIGYASCENDELDNIYIDDGKSIQIEVTDEFAEAATRADYSGFPATTFEEGDAIGVYAFNGSSYVSSNIKFTRQSNGTWTPASAVVYNPDYTYYAYFPWRSSTYSVSASGTLDAIDTKFSLFITDASNYFWQTNQSTKDNFTASNLMIAKGIVTGTRTVKFTMQHKRGLAIIGSAQNKWYYSDATSTKYELTQVFSGNIPYVEGSTQYFLLKPNTTTSVGGLSLRAGAGKYMMSVGGELTGTPSYQYSLSTNNGSSFGSFGSSKPSWLTLTTNTVDAQPTEFVATVTNSTSTNVSLGTLNTRNVSGDATLKAASSVSNVDLSMVNNAGGTRASRTTANCYLVHAPGTYKIPLVYGNAIKNGTTNSLAYLSNTSTNSNKRDNLINHADANITAPWITASGDGGTNSGMGYTVDGASIVWQDVQNMIKNVSISADGYYLTFEVDEDKIAEGNAVVAATSSGTIVWSWHIWVTSETLSNLTTISTGSHSYQVAPVNVGQINGTIKSGTTVYAGEQCKVRATANGVTVEFLVIAKNYESGGSNYNYPSPYYQWGRKDAQYPNTGAYNESGTLQATPTVVTGSNSIGTTIKNPGKHYYYSSTYGPYNETKYNYWDINNISTGNVTTKTYKTVYDPCPPGFCVPTGNLYNFIGNSSSRSDTNWNSSNTTKTWVAATYSSNTTGSDLIFPASGYRNNSNASLGDVGSSGYCWSATPNNTQYGQNLNFNSSIWYWDYYNRARGFPVRPVAEE